MPKRTNYFQQLIHHLYCQLAPAGATVTESAMLTERTSSTQREVDILIEHSIADHRIRLGIECRDRSAKDDITWVDSVIGKYRDLDVQKVILVSSSGFSEGAKQKAKAHNIEPHFLEEFSEFEIRQNINTLRMTFIHRSDYIRWAVVTTEPKLEDGEIDPSLIIHQADGAVFGALESLIMRCYEPFAKEHITSHVNKNMDEIFPSDLEFEHEEIFDIPMNIPEPYPYFFNPEKCFITHILLSIQCKFSGREKPINHYWYNKHQVAIVHITDKNELIILRKPD